ncbi:MAG TPA: hypothetical protein VGH23_21405 [Rhizomicrobium sp.]|jgi:hypothetical protein
MTIKRTIPLLLCSAIALGVTGAHADTRDEVLSGIRRCGEIHDDKTWLDCLYGAEQPMRAHLGLQPAPEFQQRLVPAGPIVPLSAMPAAAAAPPPPAAVATRPAPRKKPGFWSNLLGETPPYAVSRMASYRYEKNGAFVVTLQNGQQWRQMDVDSGVQASWLRPASSYTVTISQGAFGSYSLHTDDNPRVYKVEMVR